MRCCLGQFAAGDPTVPMDHLSSCLPLLALDQLSPTAEQRTTTCVQCSNNGHPRGGGGGGKSWPTIHNHIHVHAPELNLSHIEHCSAQVQFNIATVHHLNINTGSQGQCE